jgi:hypothetical protein
MVVAPSRIEVNLICQCRRCLDCFSIGAVVSGRRIVHLETHPKVIRRRGISIHHTCGGSLSFFGSVSFN